MVSGCGLGEDTTTSLAALGYNISKETILKSLIENSSILGRELYSE
jgi:hypothetical protein